MRIAIGIEYDGSAYNGWQRQRVGLGVQERLEDALSLVANQAVEATCAGGREPRSLSISVADTRLHFSASELAGAAVVEAMLNLPQEQLAPVRIDGFCRTGEEDGRPRFVLEDAYTARLSLRCGPDGKQTMTYSTLPLDIDLSCRRAETGPDQDSASLESRPRRALRCGKRPKRAITSRWAAA